MTVYDLNINQGSSFANSITAKDATGDVIDLTGYTGYGYIKFKYSDTGILANLNPTISNTPTSGVLVISIDAATTALLPITKAVYDVEIRQGNYVTKLLRGYVEINPEATK